MAELVAILLGTLAAAGLLTLVAARADALQRRIEIFLTYVSASIILFVMGFVLAEVVMRYAFNSPIPGHLEGAELLLPMIVFFAVSYTQATNGHVGMVVVVDALPPGARRVADLVALILSLLTCAVLAYFGTKYAYSSWEVDDVTMTPPYWRTWPSSAAIALGYFLLSVRMWLQVLRIVAADRFPEPEIDAPGLAPLE